MTMNIQDLMLKQVVQSLSVAMDRFMEADAKQIELLLANHACLLAIERILSKAWCENEKENGTK